jgi:hypothetical protein
MRNISFMDVDHNKFQGFCLLWLVIGLLDVGMKFSQ